VSCAAPEPSPSFVTVQVAGVSSVAWCSEFIFRRTERFASRAYVSRVSIRVLSARYYEIPSLALFPSLSRSPLRLYRYASHTRIFVFFPILSLSLSLSCAHRRQFTVMTRHKGNWKRRIALSWRRDAAGFIIKRRWNSFFLLSPCGSIVTSHSDIDGRHRLGLESRIRSSLQIRNRADRPGESIEIHVDA
jgi:hypothetical protein